MKRLGTYGILVLGLVLVGLALWMLRGHSEDAAPSGQPSPAASAAPQSSSAAPVIPSFDIVRISPDGNTVIAGRAAPGAEVIIYDGKTELGRAKADERGEWVFLPEKALPPGTRNLNLAVLPPDGNPEHALRSESDVVLVVPQPGSGGVVAVQMPQKGGASRVLQRPGDATASTLTIAAIDYDQKGRLGVSGNADPGARIVVYLDNAEVGEATAAANGDWRMQSNSVPVAEGDHLIRADQVDAKGAVLKRAEVRFHADRNDGAVSADVIVVVQPGNSLWRIARRIYGEGMAYTVIFEANRTQIRNPDLIYPGQKFLAPKGSDGAPAKKP